MVKNIIGTLLLLAGIVLLIIGFGEHRNSVLTGLGGFIIGIWHAAFVGKEL